MNLIFKKFLLTKRIYGKEANTVLKLKCTHINKKIVPIDKKWRDLLKYSYIDHCLVEYNEDKEIKKNTEDKKKDKKT